MPFDSFEKSHLIVLTSSPRIQGDLRLSVDVISSAWQTLCMYRWAAPVKLLTLRRFQVVHNQSKPFRVSLSDITPTPTRE